MIQCNIETINRTLNITAINLDDCTVILDKCISIAFKTPPEVGKELSNALESLKDLEHDFIFTSTEHLTRLGIHEPLIGNVRSLNRFNFLPIVA